MKLVTDNSNTTPWHVLDTEDILQKLGSDAKNGLSEKDALKRLEEVGPNELEEKKSKSPFRIFISQFNDFMIWILIAAALISGIVLREITDAIVIIVILIINSVLGFVQEYRAEKALAALKELAAPTALVMRAGHEKNISSKLLVPGDMVRLSSGNMIPADCRVITSTNLQTNEAPITGESMAVDKTPLSLDRENIPLGDRINLLFAGTTVSKGRCTAIVIGTGNNTEVGKIASLVQEKEELTPLQKELKTVGTRIGIICLSVSAIVFVAGIIKGFLAISQGLITSTRADIISDMFLVAVALAVASIPEGLPAIVTISLALGVQKMAKNNAIVRKLSSVETLGGVSVICTDKTGTLTQNKMAVRKLYEGLIENRAYKYSSDNNPLECDVQKYNIAESDISLKFLLESAVLCNDAYYMDKSTRQLSGDPTETALIELGTAYSLDKDNMEAVLPRQFEEPFDSIRKMMTTVHWISEGYLSQKDIAGAGSGSPLLFYDDLSPEGIPKYIMFSKGAPEMIERKCSRVIKNNRIEKLTSDDRQKIGEINTALANGAMRNLAFAFKYLSEIPDEKKLLEIENDLVFSGMVGMIDPPRPEVFDAVAKCKNANINIIMVTGDHRLTAKAIGTELGILGENDLILDEEEFTGLTEEKLAEEIEKIKVFSRVSPEHKVTIVDALKKNDHIVAMTGDGINDAPSLKRADIGLSMGITGTDVSKEASDMILTDDNFATIVKAIKEGRVIYDNLKKFILFLLSCNISEVFLMFVAIVLGSFIFRLLGLDFNAAYIPLLPVQILWMNLITDGLPAFALGINPAEPNIMDRQATKRRERILSKNRLLQITWQGLILTVGALFVYFIGPLLFDTHDIVHDVDVFHTCVFTTLVLTQLLHSFNYRFDDRGIFRKGIFGNRFLNISIIGSILLQVALIYVPFLQNIFSTTGLGLYQWLVIIASSVLSVILINVINEILYFRKKKIRTAGKK